MKIRLVVVTWKDITSSAEWGGDQEKTLKDMTPVKCVSVGWILRHDNDVLVLADSWSEDGDYGGTTAIPTSVVIKIHEIMEKRPMQYLPRKRKNARSR